MSGRPDARRQLSPSARQAAQARQRRLGPPLFESVVERRIREAQEKGVFDNLQGRGRPLDLGDENPFEDPDWRLAYRILKNAGFAPRWIELGRELEADWAACEARVAAHERTMRARVLALRRRLVVSEAELADLEAAHRQMVTEITERVRAYNEKVALYNLAVPIFGLQRTRRPAAPLLERLGAVEPRRLYAIG